MWIDLSYLVKKRRGQYKKEIEKAQTPKEWDSVIKDLYPKLASYTEYKNIKKDTLYIKVSDSFLISELEACKENIKNQINKNKKIPIKTIKFTLL